MYTKISFRLAIIELAMVAITIVLLIAKYIFKFSHTPTIVVTPLVSAILISCVGSYYSIKGIKGPSNIKKIFALIVNFSFVGLLLILIITNIIDIIKVFK